MASVAFTPNLARHVSCPAAEAVGLTVGEVLEAIFAANPVLRGYVLDDQAHVRKHISIFIDGTALRDRKTLTDKLSSTSEILIVPALSGG